MEELSVIEKLNKIYEPIYFTFNPYYVQNESTMLLLKEDIEKVGLKMNYINYKDVFQTKWNLISTASYIQDLFYTDLEKMTYEDIIFVEDGSYDYIEDTVRYPDFCSDKELYMFDKDKSAAASKYKAVNVLYISENIKNLFLNIYKDDIARIRNMDSTIPIVMTNPLKEDFNFDVSEKLINWLKANGYTKCFLKKHPRDMSTYLGEGISFIPIPANIPGQLITLLCENIMIYTFPSTICFVSKKPENQIIIRFKSDSISFNESFDNIESKCKFDCIKRE